MEKGINFKVDDELYRKIKILTANEGMTIKGYIIKLILKDLEERKK